MINKKLKFFNKALAIVLSTTIIGPTGFQPTHGINIKFELSENTKNLLAIYTGISLGLIMVVSFFALATKLSTRKYINKFKEDFKDNDVQKNTYTPKQEGISWCWAACIEGMFKQQGVKDITQEDISNKVFNNTAPYFEVLRFNALPIGQLTNVLIERLDSLYKGYKYNKCMIHINGYEKDQTKCVEFIKSSIKNYREKINNNIFAICDNYNYSFLDNGIALLHYVNVVDIDEDDNITIEDPASGLSRTEKLDDFCKRYYNKGKDKAFLDSFKNIEMMSIVDEETYNKNIKSSDICSINKDFVIDNSTSEVVIPQDSVYA